MNRFGDPVQPVRDDGSEIDATFELRRVPVFDLIYHHKAGARGSVRSVNADYHEGLEVLLQRLSSIDATIWGISVDSSIAQARPEAERELVLDFPLVLRDVDDFKDLRLDITRAQKPVARRRDAKPGGGNDQKRIRISFSCEEAPAIDAIRDFLARGGSS